MVGLVLAAAGDIPAAPVVGLMAVGVVMATVGSAARDRRVVGLGIAILFVATALMLVLGFAAFSADDVDPRAPGSGPGGSGVY